MGLKLEQEKKNAAEAQGTESNQKICSHVEAEHSGGLTEKGREMGRGFLMSILISSSHSHTLNTHHSH